MKYATRNSFGSLEIRQDNSTTLPVGGRLLTDAEYELLLTGGYDLVNDIVTAVTPNAAAIAAKEVWDKHEVLENAREMRAEILNALTGIQIYDIAPTDTAALAAIAVARQALKDLPTNPAVVAAVTAAETHAAVMAVWKTISANLALASPAAAVAFKKTAMW